MADRPRFAWAFLTRQFGAIRLAAIRRVRPQNLDNVAYMDATARGLGRSTELVPIDFDPSGNSSMDEEDAESTGRAEDTRIVPSNAGVNRIRRVGSDIVELMPFWNTDEEPPVGDDPTFQQLLCLAGVFCGPLMYLIGGILFCVIPREHKQTRRWALFNLILAVTSFVYLASTGSMEEMQRPLAGIHIQNQQEHLPPPDPQGDGTPTAAFNLTGFKHVLKFSDEDWETQWSCSSTAFSRLNLNREDPEDSRFWVFGSEKDDESGTLIANHWLNLKGHVYVRTVMLSNRPLVAPLQTYPVRYIDCASLIVDGGCKGDPRPSLSPDTDSIETSLECSAGDPANSTAAHFAINLWARRPDTSVSPHTEGHIPYIEDVAMNFGTNDVWCRTAYVLRSAPAHVYISSQSIYT